MAKQIHSFIFLALALAHTVVGLANSRPFTEQKLWFVGAGLSLFLLGCLNMVVQTGCKKKDKILLVLSNALMLLFVSAFGLITLKDNVSNPLAWLLIGNTAYAFVRSLSLKTAK
ncbi:MAG: hypothetical protein MUD08_10175 [Cytophagales bacterium]|jgi:hypothetical protein|nr:hypothetical protein [Cytophagales bacterium]